MTVPVESGDGGWQQTCRLFFGRCMLLSCRDPLRFYQSREPESNTHDVTPGDWPYTQKAPFARGWGYLLLYNYGLVGYGYIVRLYCANSAVE